MAETFLSLKGVLSTPHTLKGKLSNATLRGMPVVLDIDGTMLRWRYEDEDTWTDLINLNTIDYELLTNLPTLNGTELTGELKELFMLPADEISQEELNNLLNNE